MKKLIIVMVLIFAGTQAFAYLADSARESITGLYEKSDTASSIRATDS